MYTEHVGLLFNLTLALETQKPVHLVSQLRLCAIDHVGHILTITLQNISTSGGQLLAPRQLSTGVPQGSVLGPPPLAIHMTSLGSNTHEHGFSYHRCATDTQLELLFLEINTSTESTFLFPQNAELLSSLESASLRLFKPPAVSISNTTGLRFQPPCPFQTSTPPVSFSGSDSAAGPAHHPPPDTFCMTTILEDPSCDSHLVHNALEEDFERLTGSNQPSFEDLTNENVTKRYRQQRQQDLDSKETQC